MAENKEQREAMKKAFEIEMLRVINNKGLNATILTTKQYADIIEEVKDAKVAATKTPVHYRRLKRFDVRIVNGKERLITAHSKTDEDIRLFVSLDEFFDIIHETHLAHNHAGKNRLIVEIKKKYKNITTESAIVYLSLCKKCQTTHYKRQSKRVKKGLLYVMETSSQYDCKFKYILLYLDTQNRLIQLKPIEDDHPQVIARTLYEIFTTIGFAVEICTENDDKTMKIARQLAEISEKKVVAGNSEQDFTVLHQIAEELMESVQNLAGDYIEACKHIQMKKNSAIIEPVRKESNEMLFQSVPEPYNQNLEDTVIDNNLDDSMNKWFFLDLNVLEKLLEGVWSFFDEESFVNEIKQRPGLWNAEIKRDLDTDEIDDLWEEVTKLQLPCWSKLTAAEKLSACTSFAKKWEGILDEQRKCLMMKNKNYGYYVDYELPKELKFLEPYILKTDEANDVVDDDSATAPAAKKPKLALNDSSNHLFKLQEKTLRFLERLKERDTKRWDDEDSLFFQSLVPSMKNLPPTAKYKTKIEIMKLVFEASTDTGRDECSDIRVKIERDQDSLLEEDADL